MHVYVFMHPCKTYGIRKGIGRTEKESFPHSKQVFVGGDLSALREEASWLLLSYQRGIQYPSTIISHITQGVELAAEVRTFVLPAFYTAQF